MFWGKRKKQNTPKKIFDWNQEEVSQYLEDYDDALGKYKQTFEQNKIVGNLLYNDNNLIDLEFLHDKMNIEPFGHRVKIKNAILKAREEKEHIFSKKKSKVFASLPDDGVQGSIYDTSVKHWKESQVQEWLKKVCYDPKEVVPKFRKQGIDGSVLVEFPKEPELDEFLRETLGIEAYGDRSQLCTAIEAIKKCEVYQEQTMDDAVNMATDKIPYEVQPAFKVIKFKVKKNDRLRRKFKNDEDMLPLCQPEEMMNHYLTVNWQTQEQEHHPPQVSNNKRSGGGGMSGLTSRSEGMEDTPQNKNNQEESFWDREALNQIHPMNNTMKVKLIISEIAPEGSLQRAVRDWLGPVLHQANLQPTFGMFHTAICVGPWYIEWNTSEICTPRVPVSNAALITADIEGIAVNDDFETVRRKLAEEICFWNTNKGYKNSGGNKKYVGNCQDFVEAIMDKLGVNPDWKGTALGDYFESMKRKGTCRMEFRVTRDFQEQMQIPSGKFGMEKNTIAFDNHRQLDEFVRYCIKAQPTFGQHCFIYEYRLLKGFDRAFWLRHYRKPNDDRFKPLEKEEDDDALLDPDDDFDVMDEYDEGGDAMEGGDTGCPFLDPSYYSFKRS
eukprot:gb/GECH01013369.1/.p1 GENE.gb/GECH01013369.1/~~gb/GECH01013369.1/.p1  ORF type:complete len:609 (+),score=183.01 gb/GECH01013369.1/:1-1827(+)